MIRGRSESATHPHSATAESVARLWLDAQGKVLAANSTANQLWRIRDESLIGRSLVDLLAWEVISHESDWQSTQWDVLKVSTSGKALPVQAQPFGGGDAVPVRLSLDPACGDSSGYFASVVVEEATPPTAAIPSASVEPAPVATPAFLTSDASLTWLATQAPVGVFDLDFQLGYARYSPTWKQLLGYEDSDLADTYDTWRRLLHPEDSGAAPDRTAKYPLHASRRSFVLEFRMQHRRGHYVWMQCMGEQHFGPAGELQRVLGVQFDISDRKELEEEALGAQERLLRLSHSGFLGCFDLDFIKQSFWFSSAWSALFGLPANDVSRLHEPLWPLLDTLPSEAVDTGVRAWLESHRPELEPLIEAITLRHQDGRGIPVLLGLSRHFSRKRELLHVVGFALPLNSDAVSALSGRPLPPAHLVAATIDSLSEAILIADAQGNVVYLNARAERLLGNPEAANGTTKIAQAFPLVRRSDYQPAHDAVGLHLASDTPNGLCAEHALAPRPDRSEPLPIVWSARKTLDSEGHVSGVVIVFRDPREMSLTPEELIRTNRLETLGHLASGIASDYNNLLTTILGAISQAKEHQDFSHLTNAEKACLDAKGLSRQLLSFSRQSPSAGTSTCSASELLRDAARLATMGCPASLRLELPEDLPVLSADRAQLTQAFQNLVFNAVESLPSPATQGQISVRASVAELSNTDVPPLKAGTYLQIEIQDSGEGIPPENLERIFDPFFTTRKGNTGLGLTTVLSIVKRHGGQVWVTSLPGSGSTFTVFLPALPVVKEAPVKAPPARRFVTGRVLFMDDDPAICALTASMLTSLDYTYDLAKNGDEAITLYRRYLNVGRPYDAVIMDLTVIGGMGGEECFQHLQQLHPEVRAIVCSGYDDPDLKKRCLELGFIGYLSKPYRVIDLSRILEAALGKPPGPFSL